MLTNSARRKPEAAAFIRVCTYVTLATLAYAMLWRMLIGKDERINVFHHWFVEQDLIAALLFLGCFWFASRADATARIARLAQRVGEHPVWLGALTLAVMGIGARFIHHDHPLAMDEYAVRMQAQIFANGRLVGALPPEIVDFLIPPVHQGVFIAVSPLTGEVASVYMPGFALLLAPFVALGVPWMCNPTLAALALVVMHRICLRLYGENTPSGWAMLLAVASPAFLGNALSYYSMTAHLAFSLLYVLLLLQRTRLGTLIAGAVGGYAMTLHNPIPHVLFAAPWVFHIAWQRDWRRLAILAAGYAPVFLLMGVGWTLVIGPLNATNTFHAFDMQRLAERYPGTPPLVLRLASVFSLPGVDTLEYRIVGAMKVWLWAVPALPLLAWAGYRLHKQRTEIRLLFASAMVTFFGYLLVPFDQGHGWGYRYFHSAWGVLPVLAAAIWVRRGEVGEVHRMSRVAANLVLLSLVLMTPIRAWQMETTVSSRLAQIPAYMDGTRSLTFINTDWGAFSADLIQNDPFLRHPVWRMAAAGPSSNARVARRWSPTARLVDSGPWGERWVPE
jgi:hypothetical protein